MASCEFTACDRETHQNLKLCLPHAKQRTPEDLNPKCDVKGCKRNASTHGMCSMHYQRYLRYVVKDLAPDETNTTKCDHPKCVQPLYARQLCQNHYQLYRKYVLKEHTPKPRHKKEIGERCALLDCNAPSFVKNLCDIHYRRLRRTGTPYTITIEQRRHIKKLNRLYIVEPKKFDLLKITGEINIDEIPEHVLIYNKHMYGVDLTAPAATE